MNVRAFSEKFVALTYNTMYKTVYHFYQIISNKKTLVPA